MITQRVNQRWQAAGRPADELAHRGTVVDCFKTGRRRLNADLVIAVVEALHDETGYLAHWQQALRVCLAETAAAAQVRVLDTLPADIPTFTGRDTEVEQLRRLADAVDRAGSADRADRADRANPADRADRAGSADRADRANPADRADRAGRPRGPVVGLLAGMAGVGKTQLAVHAGHQLVADGRVDTVL